MTTWDVTYESQMKVFLPYPVDATISSISHIALTIKSRFISDYLVLFDLVSIVASPSETVFTFKVRWNTNQNEILQEEGERLQKMLNKEIDAYVERLTRTSGLSFPSYIGAFPGREGD